MWAVGCESPLALRARYRNLVTSFLNTSVLYVSDSISVGHKNSYGSVYNTHASSLFMLDNKNKPSSEGILLLWAAKNFMMFCVIFNTGSSSSRFPATRTWPGGESSSGRIPSPSPASAPTTTRSCGHRLIPVLDE